MEAIKVTLRLKEVPVEIEMKDGTVKNYILRELVGSERSRYMQYMTNKSTIEKNADGGVENIEIDLDGVEAHLISLCLVDEHGKSPTQKEIDENWPSSVIGLLNAKAQRLSGLDKKSKDEAGNL